MHARVRTAHVGASARNAFARTQAWLYERNCLCARACMRCASCVHECVCAGVQVCMCACARACARAWTHASCMPACMRRAYVVHECVRACVSKAWTRKHNCTSIGILCSGQVNMTNITARKHSCPFCGTSLHPTRIGATENRV